MSEDHAAQRLQKLEAMVRDIGTAYDSTVAARHGLMPATVGDLRKFLGVARHGGRPEYLLPEGVLDEAAALVMKHGGPTDRSAVSKAAAEAGISPQLMRYRYRQAMRRRSNER